MYKHRQKINETFRISGEGHCIELTLLDKPDGYNGIVTFDVRGVSGMNTLRIRNTDGLVKLVDGVRVKVHEEASPDNTHLVYCDASRKKCKEPPVTDGWHFVLMLRSCLAFFELFQYPFHHTSVSLCS